MLIVQKTEHPCHNIKMHYSTFQLLINGILDSSRNSLSCMIDCSGNGMHYIDKCEIIVDDTLKPTEFVGWQFPQRAFITYEKTDEDWCRYFGIGKELNDWVLGDIKTSRLDNDSLLSFIEQKIRMNRKPNDNRVGTQPRIS